MLQSFFLFMFSGSKQSRGLVQAFHKRETSGEAYSVYNLPGVLNLLLLKLPWLQRLPFLPTLPNT